MTGDPTTPAEIGPTPDGTALRIAWEDGEIAVYQPRELRLACPCAGCVDEMTGRPLLDPARVGDDVYPTEIRYVGRYALQFIWSDGHDTGLYTYRYLRELWERRPGQQVVEGDPDGNVDG